MNSFKKEDFAISSRKALLLKTFLDQKINEVSSSHDEDVFYVVGLRDMLKKHLKWFKSSASGHPLLCTNARVAEPE